MRHYLTLFLLLLSVITTGNVCAQQHTVQQKNINACTIKGIYLDSLTKETEPFATIRIVRKDNPQKSVKLAVTDKNGNINISIPSAAGTYLMTLSSIGKQTIVKSFTLKADSKVLDLGKIYTNDETHNLKSVEVVAQKPLVKMDVDKISYDMEADPDSKTNTVMEMLRKVPLVTVDGDENIQVNGSSSFKIYVNGKPNTMMSNNPKDVLKSMPANSIKRIEVITSPGAKYDAEGTAGILNIVTTGMSMEGYSATFNAGVSTQDQGAGIYAMTKVGKLTFSGRYQYRHNERPKNYQNSTRENFNSEAQKYLDLDASGKNRDNFNFSTIEASYDIDSLSLLSTSFQIMGGNDIGNRESMTTMWNSNRTSQAYKYSTMNHNKTNWSWVEGNADYQRTSKKNKDRIFTLSYKLSKQPNESKGYIKYIDVVDNLGLDIVKNLYLNNNYSTSKSATPEHTFQVDYSDPLGKYHTLEFGAKYILRNSTSNNKMFEANGTTEDYVYNNNRSSHYKHMNDIFAAYLSYKFKYKIFSVMPGLRYEYTHQNIKYLSGAISSDANFSSHYDDFVPSITTSFMIGQTKTLRLEYNMRISRPDINSLNPYFDNTSPMNITQGNSNLKSEKSNTFNLNYSVFNVKYNVTAQFHHTFSSDGIESTSRLIGEGGEWFDGNKHYASAGAIYTTYANIGKHRNTGLSLFGSLNPTTKIQLFVNGDGGYTYLASPSQNLKNYGWTGGLFAGINYTLPIKLRIGLFAGGSTPNYNLQGKSSGFHFYNLRLQRSFLNDRLTISAYARNFLKKYLTFNNTTSATNFAYASSSRIPFRSFGIDVSFRIGNLRAQVKKAEHTIENNDVKSTGGSNNSSSGGQTSGQTGSSN